MSTGAAASLANRLYFPAFSDLPQAETYDTSHYAESNQGLLVPAYTWTFCGEIVTDSLSQLPVLGHRVEVRDVAGEVHSVLFYPKGGNFDFTELKTGHTLFIRYASRCFFSDLSTEAVKVEELDYVKIIPMNLDTLFYVSQLHFETGSVCHGCFTDISSLGGSAPVCELCMAARYCSNDCKAANRMQHATFCPLCQELGEVYSIDFERFTQYVPFRQ